MEELLDDPKSAAALEKLIYSLNNNYVHWDKFKDMHLDVGGDRLAIWQRAVSERAQVSGRSLSFPGLEMSWWLSNSVESQLHKLDIALAGGRGMEAWLEGKYAHRHKTAALLDETIASAQLAGAAVSKKAAKEMLLKKRIPQNTNEQLCINIFKTLQAGSAEAGAPLTESSLLQLHQSLTKDTIRLKAIGSYRTNQKIDNSALDLSYGYKPKAPREIPHLMSLVFELYNNDAEPFFIHPIVKAALIHYLVVTIRPFKDGNGRMARLLAQLYLLKKDYWLMSYLSVSNVIAKFKPQYHKVLAQSQSDANNPGYFIHFYIQSLQMAYQSLKSLVARLSKERVEKNENRLPGFNERQTAVLQWVKEDASKMVTIRELRSVYGVSKETARTDLAALVEKGALQFYHINKKTYAFVKGDGFEHIINTASQS
ncbi:Fic family protein [Niabella insulamsoli]|uniref:Fic family protein n=1 Tax=Niabella insulamsoli TaxID=3144874 RepID=UPI0031FC5EC5